MDHRRHRKLDRILFSEEFPDVHKYLDSTCKTSGKYHRRDFVHSPISAIIYGLLAKDKQIERILSGLFHILADELKLEPLVDLLDSLLLFININNTKTNKVRNKR